MLCGKTALKWELFLIEFLYLSEGSSFFTSFLSVCLSHNVPLHLRQWSIYTEPSQDHEFLVLLWHMKWMLSLYYFCSSAQGRTLAGYFKQKLDSQIISYSNSKLLCCPVLCNSIQTVYRRIMLEPSLEKKEEIN